MFLPSSMQKGLSAGNEPTDLKNKPAYRVRRYAGFVYLGFAEMFSDKPDNISMEKAAAGENRERTLNFIRYI